MPLNSSRDTLSHICRPHLQLQHMRPTVQRPDLDDLEELLLDRHDAESDEAAKKRIKGLRFVLVSQYRILAVDMHQVLHTHASWAWCMRVVVEKCLRDIMRLGLAKVIYQLVYSVYLGSVAAPVPRERLQKFGGGYDKENTTFKDAYDITVAYFNMFDHDEKGLKEFCSKHDDNSVLEYLYGDYLKTLSLKPGLPRKDGESKGTLHGIARYLWTHARSAYFQLKKDGQEIYDFDVLFERDTSPFHHHVFVNLAVIFLSSCGWLPVGDNVGLFSHNNMLLENRTRRSPGIQQKLYNLFRMQGNPPSDWERWWKRLTPSQKKVAHDRMILIGPGLLDVAASVSNTSLERFQLMFPGIKNKMRLQTQQYVADEFQLAQVLHSDFITTIDKYAEDKKRHRQKTGDVQWLAPLGYEEVYDIGPPGYYDELVENNFHMDQYFESTNFDIPSPITEGRITDLPFQKHLQALQNTKEFFFFKSMFTDSREKDNTYYGMFLQGCIEYSNWHDPEIWYNEDDDWVDWYVTDEDHPLVVKDKRLFVSMLPPDNKTLIVEGDRYQVSERGYVCYAYDRQGKPMRAMAYYCKDVLDNLLSKTAFAPLIGVCHKNSNYMVQLPRLECVENVGGETVLYWRGQELFHLDLMYWHTRLGHVDNQKLKKYRKVVKGLPPYFWQPRVRCGQCMWLEDYEDEDEDE